MDKLKQNGYLLYNWLVGGNLRKSILLVSLLSIVFSSLIFAGEPTAISSALSQLCAQVKSFLGVAMMLMILLAAVIYAAGQIMGAETRARASVWATAMFTGAIFAAVIFLIVPWVIGLVVGGDVSDQIAC
ncbi:MAG TPA: hypothetical protein VJH24_04155 [Candidatus Bilamarchaeaceae archaeon]|nr:hypothetical protein [Candidatus Bilamarchaeaceae archaeon]